MHGDRVGRHTMRSKKDIVLWGRVEAPCGPYRVLLLPLGIDVQCGVVSFTKP